MPSSGDTTKLESYRDKTLNAIITIPTYDSYRRGYSINSISFNCKLDKIINWTEPINNELPIEKLPTYKYQINFEATLIDLENKNIKQ